MTDGHDGEKPLIDNESLPISMAGEMVEVREKAFAEEASLIAEP